MLKPVGSLANVQAQRSAAQTSTAPVAVKNVKVQADSTDPPTPTGIAKWAADKLVKVGGDIKKLPLWEKIVVSAVGFFVGWKFDGWVHDQVDKANANRYDKEGQDQYESLKAQGTDALVAALAEKHTFVDQLHDPLALKWKSFDTWTVLREIDNASIGTYNGKPNMPVALIALASNKTADKDALTSLAAGIRSRINGTPAKQEFYQPVIDALKAYHGITV